MSDRREENKIKVLVVDDNLTTQRELKTLLELEEDVAVIGFANDGKQAVTEIQKLSPDVVLMDYVMPRMNGLEAASAMHQLDPDVKIVMLSVVNGIDHDSPRVNNNYGYIYGWLSKSLVLPEEIVDAIRKAARTS